MTASPDGTLALPDALLALRVLAGWSPPPGLRATVLCSHRQGMDPGRRAVAVILESTATPGRSCTIAVESVPDAECLAALTVAALMVAGDATGGGGGEGEEIGRPANVLGDLYRCGRDE